MLFLIHDIRIALTPNQGHIIFGVIFALEIFLAAAESYKRVDRISDKALRGCAGLCLQSKGFGVYSESLDFNISVFYSARPRS